MESTWYRNPHENDLRDVGQVPRGGKGRGRGRGRGRSRGRGRGRGRGSGRQTQEPHGVHHNVAATYHMNSMGHHIPMQSAFAPHLYYQNPAGTEEMPPHWQYVANYTLQGSNRHLNQACNPAVLGFHQIHTRHAAYASYPPPQHSNYETVDQREHFQQFFNSGRPHAGHQTQATHSILPQSPGRHYLANWHPPYARYTNQTPTPNKAHQQTTDKETTQIGQKSQVPRTSSIQTAVAQQASISQLSKQDNLVIRSQSPQLQKNTEMPIKPPVDISKAYQIVVQTPENLKEATVAATLPPEPQPQKTLFETAAFLNHPKLLIQKAKCLSPNNSAHPTPGNCVALSQTTGTPKHGDIGEIITHNPSKTRQRQAALSLNHQDDFSAQPAHLPLCHGKVQELSSKHPTYTTYNNPQVPDFRKYSELSVTLASEPPPAHQATIVQTQKCIKYPDLSTPPLAHQAPVSRIPTSLQSARIYSTSSMSPPPAHQASTSHTIHNMQSSHTRPVSPETVRLLISKTRGVDKRSGEKISEATTSGGSIHVQNKRKSNSTTNANDMIAATNQLLGDTLEYEPPSEIYATEHVVYQPQINMYTKEQIVYQPRKKILSTSKVHYQPRTDFVATAKAVYQADMLAARQTVIQSQAGTVETAEAVYNRQENTIRHQQAETHSERETSYSPRAETFKTNESVYKAQMKLFADRQTIYQYPVDAQTRKQRVSARQTRAQKETNKSASSSDNIPSNEQQENESREPEKNMAMLQQLLQHHYNIVLSDPSNSVTPNQTLRQTRKRKISTTQLEKSTRPQQQSAIQPTNELVSRGSASSSRAPSAASDIQSLIALNWAAQSLETGWQVILYFINFLQTLLTFNIIQGTT